MNNIQAKTKLCWSCEGRVAQDVENCPYCGVYLSPAPHHLGKGDPIVPLYAKDNVYRDKKAPQPAYQPKEKEPLIKEREEKIPTKAVNQKESLMPLFTLLSGTVFLIFGLALFLFSDQDGYFTLKWNGGLWPLYLALSAILLFFGWRTLNRIED